MNNQQPDSELEAWQKAPAVVELRCGWHVSSTWEDGLDDLWNAVEELVRDEASEQERRRQESF